MKIYKNKYTDKKITETDYMLLSDRDQRDYKYIGSTTGNKSNDDVLLSGIVGYVTNSGILGGLIGGSLLGGIFGDMLNNDDDNILF